MGRFGQVALSTRWNQIFGFIPSAKGFGTNVIERQVFS
jgi:hypothetical protein